MIHHQGNRLRRFAPLDLRVAKLGLFGLEPCRGIAGILQLRDARPPFPTGMRLTHRLPDIRVHKPERLEI